MNMPRAMAEGDGEREGPDTRLVRGLVEDLADAASSLEAAAEQLAMQRDELSSLGVLEQRMGTVEQAVADLGGSDGLLVRVSALETVNDDKKDGNATGIALVAVLIALGGVLVDLIIRLTS